LEKLKNSSKSKIQKMSRIEHLYHQNKVIFLLVCTAIILLIALVFYSISNQNEEKALIKLNVSVSYADKMFTIKNNDTIDIVHADLAINEHYKIRDINLKQGEIYSIWQVEFVHYNGRNFPINQRPVKFSVWCELNDNKKGYFNKKLY
jgi:hypothetical protein